MAYENNKIIVGKIFVKFCDAGKSMVPNTSNNIAENNIKYTFIYFLCSLQNLFHQNK